jgi:hypothetical protein
MFMAMFLDTMELEMPTMNMSRGKFDDSDAEEEIHIKLREISIVCHERHIVEVDGLKVPLTISLVGNHEKYLGIKAVVFNRFTKKEEGTFLRVETDEWRYDKDTIAKFPPVRKKDPLKYFYSLPKVLEENGFRFLFDSLKFSEDRIPYIKNELGQITNIDCLSKSYLMSNINFDL